MNFNGDITLWIITATAMILAIYIARVYANSPTWGDKRRLTIFFVLVLASTFYLYATKQFWIQASLKSTTEINTVNTLYSFAFTYFLMSLTLISFAAYEKGGFFNLNGYSERGLISWLICGLIIGPIGWSIIGLTHGLITMSIIWLILGLIIGWKAEFKGHPSIS